VWSSVAFTKEASEIMSPQIYSGFPTAFQQIFVFFCVLMIERCIFLFSQNLASKFKQLLITTTTPATNQIQREFDSNVHIATFEFSQPQNIRAKKQTFSNNSLSPSPCEAGEACCHFAPPKKGLGVGIAPPTFLFAPILGLKHKAQQHTMLAQRFER
jgi:hypothetical protein